MKKQLLLGLMAMTLPWTAWADSVQKTEGSPFVVTIVGADADDASIVYNGEKTKPEIKVSYVSGEREQELDATQYVIDWGTYEDKVGEYTITVKGEFPYDGYNAATATFKVTQREVTGKFTLADKVSKTYGETDQSIMENLITGIASGSNFNFADGENYKDLFPALKVGRYETTDEGEDAGKYRVIILSNGDETANYKYIEPDGGGQFAEMTITPKPLTAEFIQHDTYNGYSKQLDWYITNNKVKIADGGIINSDVVTISELKYYTDDAGTVEGEVKDANSYDLTAILSGEKSKNYTIGKVTLTIDPATLTITKSGSEDKFKMDFDGKTVKGDLTDEFEYTTFFKDDENEILHEVLTMEWRAEDANAGKNGHEVLPYVNGQLVSETNKLKNYNIVYEDVATFVINPKTIENDWISIETKDLTYQGKLFDASGKLVVKYTNSDKKEVTLVEGTDYEKVTTVPAEGSDRNGIDANTKFTVKINGINNYAGTEIESEEFVITKAPLAITAKAESEDVKWSKEYTAIEYQDVLTNQFTYTDFKEEDDAASIGLSMKKQYTNPSVGKYSVLVYNGKDLYDEQTNAFTNYEIKYETVAKFEITPATLKYSIKSETATYNGKDQTMTFVTVDDKENDFGFKGNDTWDNIARTDMTKVTKPAIAVEDGDMKNAGVHNLILMNKEEVSAGPNYKVEYVPTESTFEIEPATVTITAPTKNISFVEGLPTDADLAAWVLDVNETKIVNTDNTQDNALANDRRALRAIMTLNIDEAREANGATGKYPIAIGFMDNLENLSAEQQALWNQGGYDDIATVLANYGYESEKYSENFVTVDGKLIIGGLTNLTLDGSIVDAEESEEDADTEESEDNEDNWSVAKKLEKYNGATVNTVTIKNLRNFVNAASNTFEQNVLIKADRWYTLVLPFDITVRELSNAFGYAIVNVPNTKNTDGQARFMLTLGEVKANTLMAFKVDQDIEWNEGKTVEFGDEENPKTIVNATAEWPWATDGTNTFIGVYAMTTISKETEKFILPTDGLFYKASLVAAGNGRGYDVYPFNGYVEVGNANARIIMEEADGSTTAIDAITGEVINDAADGWYSVDGMKLNAQPTKKGIYINNGKKVVIK